MRAILPELDVLAGARDLPSLLEEVRRLPETCARPRRTASRAWSARVIIRPVQQTAATVTEWLTEGRRVAAGTLVAVDGSSPLDVGASVYIDEHGTIEGSVTGGCVESAVAQEAIAMLDDARPRRPSSSRTASPTSSPGPSG